MANYTTRTKVKVFANVNNTDSDAKIDALLPVVTSIIESATGRFFDSRTFTGGSKILTQASQKRQTELFLFNEDTGFPLFPVITLTSVVEEDVTLVEGTDFFLVKSAGILDKATGIVGDSFAQQVGFWTRKRRAIAVEITAGFAAIPGDIEQAANELVAAMALLLTKTFTTAAGEEQTVSFSNARSYVENVLAHRIYHQMSPAFGG